MQGGLQTRPYRIQASIHAQRPASIVCTQNRVMVFGEAGAGFKPAPTISRFVRISEAAKIERMQSASQTPKI